MKHVLSIVALSSVVAFAFAAPATMMTQSANTNINMNSMSANMGGSSMNMNNSTSANMKMNANSKPSMSTQSAPVQNIQLTNNQKIVEVNLPANATTGYQWFVQNYDHNLLTLSSYTYNPENTNRVGAGGTATFVFTVNPQFYDAPQTSSISFLYQQPWSPGQNVSTNTVTLTSTANNSGAKASSQNSDNDQNNWLSLPSAMQINS